MSRKRSARAAKQRRIGRLVHVESRRVGRLYRPGECDILHPVVVWRSESESESSTPLAKPAEPSRPSP